MLLSNHSNIALLYCYGNKITGSAMDHLIESLPKFNSSKKDEYGFFRVIGNQMEGNTCTKEQVAAVKAKWWLPLYYNGLDWFEYAGSDQTSINGVETGEKKDAPIFDLSGQQIKKPRKGINIIKGKKVVVK